MSDSPTQVRDTPLFVLEGFSIGYGDRGLIHDIDMTLPRRGVVVFMGPSGSGKSSLLRSLCGWNLGDPQAWTQGKLRFDGETVCEPQLSTELHARIALLPQKARLHTGSVIENLLEASIGGARESSLDREARARVLLERIGLWDAYRDRLDTQVQDLSLGAHRSVLLARLLADEPAALFVDEPLRDVAVVEEPKMIELLRSLSSERLVLVITHNKIEAQALADHVCFFSGERLVESAPVDTFFTDPQEPLSRQFLESGSAWPAPAPLNAEDFEPLEDPPVIPEIPERAGATRMPPPSDFRWVIPGKLGGMQRPGLLIDEDEDLARLRHLGINRLVTLTEDPLDASKLADFGISGVHFPIVDMGVPTAPAALELARRVEGWIEAGESVALHCKAGLGRTGTMLACCLVQQRTPPNRAIERVRLVNPGYIQNELQLDFVAELAGYAAIEDAAGSPTGSRCRCRAGDRGPTT